MRAAAGTNSHRAYRGTPRAIGWATATAAPATMPSCASQDGARWRAASSHAQSRTAAPRRKAAAYPREIVGAQRVRAKVHNRLASPALDSPGAAAPIAVGPATAPPVVAPVVAGPIAHVRAPTSSKARASNAFPKM